MLTHLRWLVLIMGVGGYKPVKAVGSAVGNRVLRPFDLDTLSVKNSLGRVFDYVAYVGTGGFGPKKLDAVSSLFTDDSIRAFEASTGRKLTASEMKVLRYATRLIQNMDDDQREVVIKAADDYLELQERIVGSFPVDMQKQAQEAFELSFAEAASLGPLQGFQTSNCKVDARDLKNLNGTEVFEVQRMQELQIERSELANNLESMVGNLQDEASKQAVLDFVNNGKQAVINHRISCR